MIGDGDKERASTTTDDDDTGEEHADQTRVKRVERGGTGWNGVERGDNAEQTTRSRTNPRTKNGGRKNEEERRKSRKRKL
ncbi:serine/arginine repetitive matrix protein 2-like isoform X2 [Anopheles sinensis]|uniref:Serine/arginine repetitive matrix protein 2-like isoform X2 n=1 Tax=Anopheles sinensis TaxID=74873 RepID=A0A084WH59_ANOSI|nr:serine/arginine repetitive matrix protein 2-like isoform X2 [Anopheles sinensis]